MPSLFKLVSNSEFCKDCYCRDKDTAAFSCTPEKRKEQQAMWESRQLELDFDAIVFKEIKDTSIGK